ncbi:MAG: copper-binding protein [Hyphomonas sp.]|uniref:copper-binding protein n=1 Tax=Hyphomonas sp. TaxID=87 RepID=UPI0030026DB5
MKTIKGMKAGIILGGLASTLVACGQAPDPYAKVESPAPDQFVEPANPALQQELSGEGQGTIVSIGPDGDFLSIDHGPIEGVGMGAMTMGFGTLSSVDLSQLSKGSIIAFRVKKGRDGSFRVTAICDVQTSGDNCLTESVGE